jgi:hypothetical protein
MSRIYFKFRNHSSSENLARTLSIISDGKIYAPQLGELNDPCEGFILRTGDCKEENEAAKLLKNNIRVVSTCRYYSNALLWSYYADSYSGVCLAISFPEDTPKRVIYSGLHDNCLSSGPKSAAEEHAKRKLECWKHEVEYRVIKVAPSKDDPIFVPCKVHGALFGEKTPEDIRSLIQKAGKSVNSDFLTDVVKLHPSLNHPCLGANLGVRANEINNPQWLRDGLGHLPARQEGEECLHCGHSDSGYGAIGFFLEEHLVECSEDPNSFAEEKTILLCPNCHRKAHSTASTGG